MKTDHTKDSDCTTRIGWFYWFCIICHVWHGESDEVCPLCGGRAGLEA